MYNMLTEVTIYRLCVESKVKNNQKPDINIIKNEKSPPRRRTASLGISPPGESLFTCELLVVDHTTNVSEDLSVAILPRDVFQG
jgi:hypothetical protein